MSFFRNSMDAGKCLTSLPIALALVACGGGGIGGGAGIISVPPPPSGGAPPPTGGALPPSGSFTIGAPARPTMGTNPAQPVLASETGPNFSAGPAEGTTFPVLQTVLGWANVGNADDIYPDDGANSAGGTMSVESGHLKLNVPRLVGTIEISGLGNLDWARVGYWDYVEGPWDYDGTNKAVFVFGYETPAGSVPTTGIATYNGRVQGSVFYPAGDGGVEDRLSGNAAFAADFGARTVTGSLTGMTANGAPWNNVAFASTIAGNGFSGTTHVTSAPGGAASLNLSAAGALEGKFFGPGALEAAAVWTLYDGVKAAIGTLSGKRP